MGNGNCDRRVAVLFAIPALDKGGPDRVFFELLRRIDRQRFSVSVVVSGGGGYYLERLPDDVTVHVLPSEHNVYFRYPLWHLARLVRQLRPDIVFATLRMTMTAGLSYFAFPRHTTLVLRVANQISINFIELQRCAPIKHRVSYRLQTMALGRADRIICQSTDMVKDLRSLGLSVPMTVIGNPIDVQEVAQLASPKIGLPGDPALLSVGRLVPQKGFDILLAAFGALRRRHPGAVLSIVGEGPERLALEAQCRRLELGDSVRLLGFVSNPYPLMAGADLFVLASRYEGFPNAVLEALACGTPVVVTDCPGGTRDLVQPGLTGLLAKPEDPADLAIALDAALSGSHNFTTQKLQSFVAERFGSERVVIDYETALLASNTIRTSVAG